MTQGNTEFLYDYLRAAYEFQLQRMEKLRDRNAFITGLLLVLGGALWSLAHEFQLSWPMFGCRDLLFWSTWMFASVLFGIASLLTAFCVAGGYSYAIERRADEVFKYNSELEKYNLKAEVKVKLEITSVLKKELCMVYSESAAINKTINDRRTAILVVAMRFAFASAVFAILPAGCVLFLKNDNIDKPVQVKIIDGVSLKSPSP